MKKVFFIFLVGLVFLTGCNKTKTPSKDSLNLSNDISIMTIEKDYYNNEFTENKYLPYTLKDHKKLVSIIDELNSLKVEQIVQEYKVVNCLYYLQFNGLDLYLIEDNKIYLVKNDSKITYYYNIIEGKLDTINSLDYKENPSYSPKGIKEMDLSQQITVKDVKQDITINLTGDKELIKHLEKIVYVKVKDGVSFGNITYVITIGANKIEVVDNERLYVNGVKNCILEGSLEFLKSINFENTGWLPWV